MISRRISNAHSIALTCSPTICRRSRASFTLGSAPETGKIDLRIRSWLALPSPPFESFSALPQVNHRGLAFSFPIGARAGCGQVQVHVVKFLPSTLGIPSQRLKSVAVARWLSCSQIAALTRLRGNASLHQSEVMRWPALGW